MIPTNTFASVASAFNRWVDRRVSLLTPGALLLGFLCSDALIAGVPLVPWLFAYITFANDGTLSGSAGCNSYTTSYTLDGGEIEIAPPAATKKACAAPEGVMEQEAAYVAELPSATHFSAEGGTLALLAGDGTYVASYVPAG